MIYLKLANLADAEAEYEAFQKVPPEENGLTNKYSGMSKAEFLEKGLPGIIADANIEPTGNYVPQSYYFLWDDDKIVGWFKFRHQLCESLKRNGGHIGYVTIPEYRGKGYAAKGLKLLLDEVRDIIPEDEFWLFAHKDNLASQKVMLANGAYKVGEEEIDGITYVQMRIKKQMPEKIDTAIIVDGVLEKDGKYFLVQEAQKKCRGKWNLPAGHLDPNELIVEGAKREILEESGFEVEPTAICQIGNRKATNRVFISIIFTTKIIAGEIKYNPAEIMDARWFSYEEIIAMKSELRNVDLVLGAIDNVRNNNLAPLELIQCYR